jgi:H+-transporting ATPase
MAESRNPALDTQIESGKFDEKHTHASEPEKHAKKAEVEDEEEDEDIDALIEDLESQDGHGMDEDEEDETPGGARVVPEDMLQTDTRIGMHL